MNIYYIQLTSTEFSTEADPTTVAVSSTNEMDHSPLHDKSCTQLGVRVEIYIIYDRESLSLIYKMGNCASIKI